MDDLKCDISSIIPNSDFRILTKLKVQWSNFSTEITARIEDFSSYKHEYSERKVLATNKIADLEHDIERLKTEIDSAQLQQKILVKKISNAGRDLEQLVGEVEHVKAQRDSLSVEIVDLQQECEKRKEKKLLTWDAIKRACQIYNQHLDFHIQLQEINNEDYVKVSFFLNNENSKDQYYVSITHNDNQWTVNEIHPILKKEYLCEFRGLLDTTSNKFKISNVTAFLCCLRSIFKKYYIN